MPYPTPCPTPCPMPCPALPHHLTLIPPPHPPGGAAGAVCQGKWRQGVLHGGCTAKFICLHSRLPPHTTTESPPMHMMLCGHLPMGRWVGVHTTCTCHTPACICHFPACTCHMPTCTCHAPACTCHTPAYTCHTYVRIHMSHACMHMGGCAHGHDQTQRPPPPMMPMRIGGWMYTHSHPPSPHT